jgi:hypothetical protein
MGAMAQQSFNWYEDADYIPIPKYEIYQEMTNEQIVNNINEINISLKKYCRMQVGGEIAMIAGSAIAACSTVVHYNNINISNYNQQVNAGMIVGSVVVLTGYIVKMCAYSKIHKIHIQGSSIIYIF